MSASVEPAVIGLVGVLVGGFVATGGEFYLYARRRGDDRERAAADRGALLREAVRLVSADLALVLTLLDEWVQKGGAKPVGLPDAAQTVESWGVYRAVLARGIEPQSDWVAVLHGAWVAQQALSRVEEVEPLGPSLPANPLILRAFVDYRDGLSSALGALDRVAGK